MSEALGRQNRLGEEAKGGIVSAVSWEVASAGSSGGAPEGESQPRVPRPSEGSWAFIHTHPTATG